MSAQVALALFLAAILATSPPANAARLMAGQPFTAALAEELLLAALPPAVAGARWVVRTTEPSLPIANSARGDAAMSIEDLKVDPVSGELAARVLVVLAAGETGTIELRGRAEQQVSVPVLRRALASGERIAAADLEFRWLARGRLQSGAVVDLAELVGREVAHRTEPGRPLRGAEVRPPTLVRRDQAVVLVYQRAGMQMVAAAVAAESGSLGQLIRVVNPSSGRELRGRVMETGRVRIDADAGEGS